MPKSTVDINIFREVETALFDQIDALSSAGDSEHTSEIRRESLIGLYVLSRALRQFRMDTIFDLLRPANWLTYRVAKLRWRFAPSSLPASEKWQFFFYETYGFRFVVWINLETKKGSVVHMCRIKYKSENSAQNCLDEAKAKILAVVETQSIVEE